MMRTTSLVLAVVVCGSAWGQTPAAPSAPAAVAQGGADPERMMALRRELGLAIASAYGFMRWEQVSELSFTFNARLPGREVERSWTWRPKSGEVTLHRSEGGPLTFRFGRPKDEAEREADAWFVNDHYWLLFPFQLVWSDPELTDHGSQPLPMGEGEARKVTVQYPSAGGYTPGDAYDLYLGEDSRIVQWVYRKGGGAEGRPATWEGNVSLGPIVVSTEHWGPGEGDERFRLWFTGLSVKVSDGSGEAAVEPEPVRSPE